MKIVQITIRCLFFFIVPLSAMPRGGEVIQGKAEFHFSHNAFEVLAEGNSILHWDEFSIASHEAVHFLHFQPDHGILNRVVSGKSSEILGNIQANCPIYLINPNGVFIGSNAIIETAGFLASTADLSNEAFLKGEELIFHEFGVGSIVNLGKISASTGDVFLIARKIDNQGIIDVADGKAILTTCEMILNRDTKKCIFIRTEGIEEEGIQNSGSIQALAVEFNTCSPYEKAIQHTGLIEAFSSVKQNGRIFLVAENGTTCIEGSLLAESGEIRVLGQTVVLEENARIDASGNMGGTILIGGDYQGSNPDVLNAQTTSVAKGSAIYADSFLQGNGGKVIVWSDQTTSYAGEISACGGRCSGDGGFVEVSGKQLLFEGHVSTDAPFGKTGTLLLDPTNVTISAADSGGSFSGCIAGTNTFTPDAVVTDTIAAATLNGLLDAPCNVVISTVGSAGGGTGAITVSSAVSWSSATTLTLTAASFITVSASITNNAGTTGFQAVNMTANGVGATTNPGILLSAGTITTMGGDVVLNGTASATATASHGVSLNGGLITTGSGNISVTGTVPVGATGASVHGVNMNTVNGMSSASGNITVSGTTNTSGTTGFGVQIAQAWIAGTTGTVAFSNCNGGTGTSNHGLNLGAAFTGNGPVTFSNCIGGNNATTGGHGINVVAAFTTAGAIQATSSITGRGNGGIGFASSANFSTTGASHPITITASATGTAGASHGIALTGGSMSTNAGDSITLQGTGGASNTASFGINITGGASTISTTTGNGAILLTGTASGSGAGIGTRIAGSAAGVINSTSGTITISGTSTATGAGSHGVSLAAAWTPATTGLITFTNCNGGNTGASHGLNLGGTFTGSGDVVFSSCIGGTGGGSGINQTAGFTTVGNITATSSIIGRGGGGKGYNASGLLSATGVGSSISITASATGTTGNCAGISGSISTTGGGSITLHGTGGPSNTVSHGISVVSVSTTVGNGPIFATGIASGTATDCHGIGIESGAGFSSTTGNITLTGVSTSTGNTCHGVGVAAAGWSAVTTGTFTFLNCAGGTGLVCCGYRNVSGAAFFGDVVFSNCTGGGSNGFGVNIPNGVAGNRVNGNLLFLNCTGTGTGSGVLFGSSIILGGNVTFSNCVGGTGGGHGCQLTQNKLAAGSITTILPLQGRGNGGCGLFLAGNDLVATNTGIINITANAIGTTGACHGISMGGGDIITTGGGNITLNGTAGPSSTASHGIDLGVTSSRIRTQGAGTVTCFGTGGAGTGGGYGVFLSGLNTSISSAGGLSVTGIGAGTGVNSGGIGVFSSAIITGSSTVTLNGTASTTGGDNSRGIIINGAASAVSTTSGNIIINGTGGGTGLNSSGLEVSSGGKINSTTGSISGTCVGGAGSSGCAGILVTGAGSQITTASGAGINLTGTGSGTTVGNQGISLASAGVITTTNNAPITLTGTGSAAGASSNEGIFLTGASTAISTVRGIIQLAGTPGGGTTNGITIDTSANISTSTSGGIIANSTGRLLLNDNGNLRTLGVGGPNLNDIAITTAGVSILPGATGSATISTVNGNIDILSSDSMLLTASATASRFAQCTVGNAANTLSIRSVGLTLTGSGSGSFAEVSTNGGQLSIDGTPSSSGAILLTGGSNANAYAQIITKTTVYNVSDNAQILLIGQGIGNIHPTNLTLQGGTAGTPSYAIIATNTGGNIVSTITGICTLTGGSGTGSSSAGIYTGFTSGSGNITATASRFLLNGGSNTGTNRAEITTSAMGGGITLTGTSGLSRLQGGSGAITQARIITNGTGAISFTNNGALSLLGSTTAGGTNASATISTANGNIGINTTGLLTMTGGSQSGTISQITVGNSANTVSINSVGASVAGGTGAGAFAEISTIGGLLTVDGAGALTLTGGTNTNTDARIITKTNNIAGDAILIGQITPPTSVTLSGGSGATSSQAIIASDQGGNIVSTITGVYTISGGTGTTDSRAGVYAGFTGGTTTGSGNINLTGSGFLLTGGISGAGTELAEIVTGSGGGAITLSSSGGNVTLQAGGGTTSNGSNANIESKAPNSSVNLLGSGIVTLNGGTATDQHSYIQTTSAVGINPILITCSTLALNGSAAMNGSAELKTVVGDISATTSGNMLLMGGGGLNANALIQAITQGTITLNAQNLDVQGGSALGQSGILTQSGDINVVCAQNCQYQALTPGSLAIMQTLGSDLTVTTGGAINLSGFTIYSTPDPGNLLLIAGTDITIGMNTQVIANGTANSSLTLVVDNAFPSSPNIGPGQFVLDLGGDVSTGLVGTTPLRIYTARRTQNTISNLTINGMPYVPGPVSVDTATEMWGLYYPAGPYGGVAFTVYYKEKPVIPPPPPPSPSPFPVPPHRNVALSLEELTGLLPILSSSAIPFRFPGYHFQLCKEYHKKMYCDPIFSPYGSFIFEDDVYWIGTSF